MRIFLATLVFIILTGVALIASPQIREERNTKPDAAKATPIPSATQQNSDNPTPDTLSQVSIVAEGLDTPWAIAFLPNKGMLITERVGRVRLVDPSGKLQENPVATIQNVREIGEGGLMGITLHPDFSNNNFVYLYYTYSGSGNNTLNRVVRMAYQNNSLTNEQIIVDRIPGASNHNGGRIKFGPDNYLYIATGDVSEPSLSQNKNSLAGKILRVTDDGKPVPGNPFSSQIYSYGHRNPQGITWDSNGTLWATEHGPSGGNFGNGNDEVNLIESGKNYGWPEIQGDQTRSGMEVPAKHSGRNSTWAPGGIAFVNNKLFFVGLRGQALFEATVQDNKITSFKEHFKGQYGRLRESIAGPDGMLYITTSNKDGRGNPESNDDRIIKINPQKL